MAPPRRELESFDKPCVLAVEGEDQYYLLRHVLCVCSLSDSFDVVRLKGVTQLRPFLGTALVTTGFDGVQALGVMRDAEEQRQDTCVPAAASALQSVADAFRDVLGVAGLTSHAQVMAGEVAGRPLRVGAFIAPDGVRAGMLEDLCLSTAPVRASEALRCVDYYLECLGKANVLRPTWPKRRLHAYLAACEEPGKKLGEAARAGYLHLDDPVWNPLKQFLRDLAGS